MIKWLLAAVAAFTCSAVAAQEHRGSYVGIDFGQLRLEDAGPIDFDDKTEILRVFGGFRFGPDWSVEGSFGRSNDLNSSLDFLSLQNEPVTRNQRVDYEIISVRALRHFGNLYAGLGIWKSDIRSTVTYSPPIFFGGTGAESDSGGSFVIGGQWDFNNISMRAELEHMNSTRNLDINRIGFSVLYRF